MSWKKYHVHVFTWSHKSLVWRYGKVNGILPTVESQGCIYMHINIVAEDWGSFSAHLPCISHKQFFPKWNGDKYQASCGSHTIAFLLTKPLLCTHCLDLKISQKSVFLTAVTFRGLAKYLSDIPPKLKKTLKCMFFYQLESVCVAYKISYFKNPFCKN